MTGTVWAKFYWSDWLSDPALARCSLAAQGLWMRLLCIAAQGDPIGFVAMNGQAFDLRDIARLGGVSESEAETLIGELDRYGVLSRDRTGTIYSRRMVREKKKADSARKNGKMGGNPILRKQTDISASDNHSDKATQKGRHKTHMPEAREKASHEAFSSASPPVAAAGLLEGKPPPAAPGKVWIDQDSAEWPAYAERWAKRHRSRPPTRTYGSRSGWFFSVEDAGPVAGNQRREAFA